MHGLPKTRGSPWGTGGLVELSGIQCMKQSGEMCPDISVICKRFIFFWGSISLAAIWLDSHNMFRSINNYELIAKIGPKCSVIRTP